MNRNMEDTRKWYAEHGMLDVFAKKYICSKCKHAMDVRIRKRESAAKSLNIKRIVALLSGMCRITECLLTAQ